MQYASETFFLYGPPATGKSTCARNLAAALGKRAVDLDALIEARVGMSIPDYVAQAGREAFRDAESATLEALCAEAPRGIGIVNIFNVRWFVNAGAVGLQTKACKAPIPIEVFYS